jgi:hypothetical protein
MQRLETTEPFEDRLAKRAADMRERAESLPPSTEREELLRLASQCESAASVAAWIGNKPSERASDRN